MQDKKNSFKESFINTFIGLITSFALQIIMYPSLGIEVTLNQNFIITSVFFSISVLRGYLIRRIFNK
jgi:hypothetical protein